MRKALILMVLMALIAPSALAWKVSLFGYDVQYTPVVDQTSAQKESHIQFEQSISNSGNQNTNYFEEERQWLNAQPEVSTILKELDYRRIGYLNMDDGQFYTIFVNDWGMITDVKKGNYDVEATIQASESQIRGDVERGDTDALRSHIIIPFSMKMKLAIAKVF